ncbi:MAG TPA: hypothetical protein ENN03_03420 [bacterium]|nr:hypothetical protein [bacterium]
MSAKLPNRHSALWILPAVAGTALLLLMLNRFYPSRAANLQIGRRQAVELARRFLDEQGHDVESFRHLVYFVHDAEAFTFLQKKYGYETAEAMSRYKVHHGIDFQWVVLFFRNLPRNAPQERFWVSISGFGRFAGFRHEYPAVFKWPRPDRARLEQQEALDQAVRFLSLHDISLDDFTRHLFSSQTLQHRTDHLFQWRKDLPYSESQVELTVQVRGDKIGLVNIQFQPPEEASTAIKKENGQAFFMVYVVSLSFFLLVGLVVLIVFLKKYHQGEAEVRRGSLIFLIVWSAFVVQAVLKFSVHTQGTQLGELSEIGVGLFIFCLFFLVIRPVLTLFGFAAWSVGESLGRERYADKFTALDGLFNGRWMTVSYARAAVQGYASGAFLLGVTAVLYWIGLEVFSGRLIVDGFSTLLPVQGAFLLPFVIALPNSLMAELVFRLFGNLYLRQRIRFYFLTAVLTSAAFAVYSLAFWGLAVSLSPMGLNLAMMFILGLCFGFLFWKYDLLTVIFANFTLVGVFHCLPFLYSRSPDLLKTGLLGLFILLIPLFLAIGGLIRREIFIYSGPSIPAHIRRITERVRMSKELEIARQVQMRLLPKTRPRIEGFEVAGMCLPAREGGGDYFDFIEFDNHRLGIVIGDVSGKGVPAAIYMTLTKGIVQSYANGKLSPRNVLIKINNLLYRTIDRNAFVSLFYAVLDSKQRTLNYSRAGHNPILYYRHQTSDIRLLEPEGIALGLDSGPQFENAVKEETIRLSSKDLLVFYTDGFTEAMDRNQNEYGEERLKQCVLKNHDLPVEALYEAIIADVRSFVKDAPQNDDMTMIFLRGC